MRSYRHILVLGLLLVLPLCAGADPLVERCRDLVVGLSDKVDRVAVEDLKALAPALRRLKIPEVDTYAVKFWMNPISHERYGIGHYQVGTKDKSTDVAILYDDSGRPVLIRTRVVFEDSGNRTTIRDNTAKFYRIREDNSIEERKSSVRIIEGYIDPNNSPFSRERRARYDDTEVGRNFGSDGRARDKKEIVADPNTVYVPMNGFALVIRDKKDDSADVAKMQYHTVYSPGYGPCTGLMIEGKGFALVSHLVNAYETPPEQIVPFLINQVKKAGLPTAGLKFRIIGGESGYRELPVGLVKVAKDLGLEVVEQDILGQELRSFGYRLGEPGSPPSAFRLR